MSTLETRIDEWRAAVLRGRMIDEADAQELESHLRDHIADLGSAGLSDDEAFLIAVGRLGRIDQLSAEFAREHSDRLWKQLTVTREEGEARASVWGMLAFAALAAVLVHAARLFAEASDGFAFWFARDLSFFVLPVLAAYFAVVRRMPLRPTVTLGAVVALLAVAVNLFPFPVGSATDLLVALHLPVVLWFAVGVAYVGGEVTSHVRRMDFIRFTGEWVIYFALIALGGGVLLGLTAAVLTPIAPEAIDDVMLWVLPAGAAGAVVVAAWLVEAKKSVIENIAPVLTAIFTPLFALMLAVSAVGYAFAGLGREFDRDLLIVFDVLLLVVLGLVVYGISARGALRRPGLLDVLQLVAVISALVLDLLVLVSMLGRIGEFGFTPNRVAALGLNLLLLINLAVTAWHLGRMLAGRAPALRLERWQTGYLVAFAAWVLLVVLALPPVFDFA
ncbi:permease prefix domain 1-containing protein [Salinibacterium sp. SYSU T00001]|uniref:permease prefix domain 1-containing protein n=1 Tax=Homoserinimonas sedimenticola TaxID=2986805 RepID=UPI002235EE9A|nr:permease prefix domain 1-containing protein [Salinibacterium sedimenticola]MCW4386588.1 permease prefix domain 1-containing protein [Salinibacterium sedimenticola]